MDMCVHCTCTYVCLLHLLALLDIIDIGDGLFNVSIIPVHVFMEANINIEKMVHCHLCAWVEQSKVRLVNCEVTSKLMKF